MEAFLSERVLRALKFASVAHKDQKRKSGGQSPYISHPAAVGYILLKAGFPEDVIISGILHDVIEDTSFTYTDIENEFGKTVADIVQHCTEDKTLAYDEQKDSYISHLETAPLEALAVSGADLLANRVDMLTGFAKGDTTWIKPPFTNDLPRKIERDWKRIHIIRERARPPYMQELERVTREVHQYLIHNS